MGRGLKTKRVPLRTLAVRSPLTQGRGLKKVKVGEGRLHTFLCERKIFTFFLRVLSMYLTFTDLHFPSFSGFFALFGAGRGF